MDCIYDLNYSQGDMVRYLIAENTPPADWLWFDPPKSDYDSMVYYKAYAIPSAPRDIIPMRPEQKAFWIAFDTLYIVFLVGILAAALWKGLRE